MTITYAIGNSLYVNVTNRCSNRCEFCIRTKGDSVGGSASLWLEREPSADEILADIRKNNLSAFTELVFCGYGEPLERLDTVVEVIRELKRFSDIRVRINTNGLSDLIFGRPTARDLAHLVDSISISLNAPDAASYDRLCHSDFGLKAFDSIVAFAADCREIIPEVIFTVVDVISPEEIEKCRAVAEKAGVAFRVRKMIE